MPDLSSEMQVWGLFRVCETKALLPAAGLPTPNWRARPSRISGLYRGTGRVRQPVSTLWQSSRTAGVSVSHTRGLAGPQRPVPLVAAAQVMAEPAGPAG